MLLVYIDFWSALKISFLIVIALLAWGVLDRTGLIGTVRNLLTSIAGAQGSALVANLTFGNILTFTLVVALLELTVLSVLGAVFAGLFNLVTGVVGAAAGGSPSGAANLQAADEETHAERECLVRVVDHDGGLGNNCSSRVIGIDIARRNENGRQSDDSG